MQNEQKKKPIFNVNVWLPNLYYVGTLISLFFIMAQVFYAKQTMVQTNEWEKAKITIENIERLQKNLSTTLLYEHPEALQFAASRIWPDLSNRKNKAIGDTLRNLYLSFFEEQNEAHKNTLIEEDLKKAVFALDAFAYPIIMGYANELGSYQNVFYDYISYGNYIMFVVFNYSSGNMGPNAKLLYRLWRIRSEQELMKRDNIDANDINAMGGVKYLLCFDESEFNPVTKKRYQKKLQKELKKVQKEIEQFRQSASN
ncbi:hypothetical protein [Bacteroides sp. 519]|uniref:hypothetical protein n=1 Tax=Bacteroides sp. 519 TaxID=2302937 RepID=UPI0013CFDE8D|nr:hypothetical protein [Bacteroides sp. 519]NDV57562.1 hypothetical protein [Bacteroides sp. 519]